MQIRLLVLDKHTCLETDGLHYCLVSDNIYKPVKLQISDTFDKEDGQFVDWQDIDVAFESEEF
jgi:hypothetical protein